MSNTHPHHGEPTCPTPARQCLGESLAAPATTGQGAGIQRYGCLICLRRFHASQVHWEKFVPTPVCPNCGGELEDADARDDAFLRGILSFGRFGMLLCGTICAVGGLDLFFGWCFFLVCR